MRKLLKGLSNNSPAILTGVAACGVVGTVIFAVKATPKAIELMGEEQERKRLDGETEHHELLSKKEIIQVAWKPYIPAMVMGTVTIACIIGSNQISTRRNAALMSLYSIAETGLKEYQSKVVETIGENKERKIRDDIDKDRLEKNPVTNNHIVVTGNGDSMCYDVLSGRYFKSNIEKIRQKVNDYNRDLLTEMEATLNDLYYELGLEGVKMGNDVGYTSDNLCEVDFSTQLTPDNEACIVLNFSMPQRV